MTRSQEKKYVDRSRLSREYRRNFDSEHSQQIKKLLALDNRVEKVNQLIFKHQNQQFFLAKDSRKKFKAKKGRSLTPGTKLKKRDHSVFKLLKEASENPKLTAIFPKKTKEALPQIGR